MEITLTELEEAINFWRHQHPAVGEEHILCAEAAALAAPYAAMIMSHAHGLPLAAMPADAQAAILAWRQAKS